MSIILYRNATVFTSELDSARGVVEAFAVTNGKFSAVGSLDEVRASVANQAEEVDLKGGFVAPGVIDSHTHMMFLGQSLKKVQLRDCKSLSEIQQLLLQARQADPKAQRLLGAGWLFEAFGDVRPTAAMLDEVLPDVPVFLDANDLHSMWVNTAALQEMGITSETPDPIGGEVARDENGQATGMLYEMASIKYGMGFLESVYTEEDHIKCLETAFQAYLSAGVTGATDMALNAAAVKALRAIIDRDGQLPFPITAHWLLETSGDVEQDLVKVDSVVSLRDDIAKSDAAPWLRIAGVKFIMDGVIDACTASMRAPYANGSNVDPIWTAERIAPVAAAADRAGLQIAMHAIGDHTSEVALSAVENCIRENGDIPRRHRIEHLESVALTTIQRMAELGVVASMQPVHSDPAVLENWKAMLGDERAELGFPWQEFRKAGVALTLGTDAPTAPLEPLPNLYIALTGASALAPEYPPYHPERAFTPSEALIALTAGGAYAGGMDDCGRIRVGMDANFININVNPLQADPKSLLEARVLGTWVRGEEKHKV